MNIPEGFETKEITTSEVKVGDSVCCQDGQFRTVCKKDIKTGFCGISIFGDAYLHSRRKVKILTLKSRSK